MTEITAQSDITTQLQELKKIIGNSYRQKIADKTGFSTRRVSQVFNDKDLSHDIIQTAIMMAEEIKASKETATAKLQSL